jgi:hypothetical protein
MEYLVFHSYDVEKGVELSGDVNLVTLRDVIRKLGLTEELFGFAVINDLNTKNLDHMFEDGDIINLYSVMPAGG